MKVVLIRHTKVNLPKGICYGQSDVDVADTFEEEKREVVRLLQFYEFEAVYASPLQRCHKLAREIAGFQHTVIYDDRLKELHFGEWEGMSWDDISQTPEAEKWFGDYWKVACPGGESYQQLFERISDFMEELRRSSIKGPVGIITHGGPIRSILSWVYNTPPYEVFDESIDYGDIRSIEMGGP